MTECSPINIYLAQVTQVVEAPEKWVGQTNSRFSETESGANYNGWKLVSGASENFLSTLLLIGHEHMACQHR